MCVYISEFLVKFTVWNSTYIMYISPSCFVAVDNVVFELEQFKVYCQLRDRQTDRHTQSNPCRFSKQQMLMTNTY